MVKIDFNQDYYADLEVGPSAGIEDIRRSYRKLDRNPGGETVAGQRFQIIQAAYEVLTNAEQKQRYDISRRTRYGGASGVKGNPYQDISKNYPPPPRPPGFAPRATPKRAPATSAADTYAKFAKDVPPTSPRTSRKPAESTFTWQAWEQMRSGAKSKATSSQAAGSGTSARASSAPKPAPAAPPPVPPRSPQKQAKGSFGSRVNRGYTPHSPSGDEPPVASNNYFTTRARESLFSETSGAEPPVASNNYSTRTRENLGDEPPVVNNNYSTRTRENLFSNTSGDEPPVVNQSYTKRTRENPFSEASTAAHARDREPSTPDQPNPNPTADLRDNTYVDTRQQTAYRKPVGEKLDPIIANDVNRSRSARESTKGPHRDDEGGSPTTKSHQHSASVPGDPKPGPEGHPEGPPEAKQGEKGASTGGNDAGATQDGSSSTPESQNRAHQGNPDAGSHTTMPNVHGVNAVGGGSSNDRDNSKLYAFQPHSRSYFPIHEVSQTAQQATCRAGDEKFFEKKTLNLAPELHELLSRRSSSEDKSTFNSGLNAFDHKMHNLLSQLSAMKYSTSYGSSMQSGSLQNAAQPQRASQQTSNADNNNAHSFDFQYADHSFTPDPHRFTRNSADNINTRFVADESDATNWQFCAGSPISETGRPAMPRSKSGSRIGRKPPFQAQAAQAPFAEPANGKIPSPNSSFNPEEWSEKIGPQIFQAPGQTQKGNTIRPLRNPSKKPKPVRMTAGTAGMVDSDENSSGQEDIPQKSPATADANDLNGIASPNAMDIDNPLEVNGVRNIHVEPSRPEWRAGDVKGLKTDTKPVADPQTDTVPPVGGSEDSEEFRTTFADLRNVEPFAQPATGLESFGDLKSNLPFPSSASGHVPLQKGPSKRVKLDLPEAPKPPNAPPTLAVQGLKPSAAAWTKYVGDFYGYLGEWHAYNTKFSDHFQARNVEVQKKLTNPGWVESRDGAGVQEYLRWAEEDRQVRAKWTEACHSHEINVRVFVAHRERMMK